MSYRAAWGKIKATENELGVELLTKAPGEKRYRLSENGQLLLDGLIGGAATSRRWRFKGGISFPWQIRKYDAKKSITPPEKPRVRTFRFYMGKVGHSIEGG